MPKFLLFFLCAALSVYMIKDCFIANMFERLSLNKPTHSFNPPIQEDNRRSAPLKESKKSLV